MQHECKITVIDKKCFTDYQEQYLADPKSGPCPFFNVGDEFILSIMKGWTNDDRMMIACCNDGTRPVIFKIERIDIPENDEEREWLAKQNFRNTVEDAYTG